MIRLLLLILLLTALAMPDSAQVPSARSQLSRQAATKSGKSAQPVRQLPTWEGYQVRTLYELTRSDEQRYDSAFVRIGSYYKLYNVRLTAFRNSRYGDALTACFNRLLQLPYIIDSLNTLPYSSQPEPPAPNVREPPLTEGIHQPREAHVTSIISVRLLITPRHDSLLGVVREDEYEGTRNTYKENFECFVLHGGRIYNASCPDQDGQTIRQRLLVACKPQVVAAARRRLKVPLSVANIKPQNIKFEQNGIRIWYTACSSTRDGKFRCPEKGVSEDADNYLWLLLPYRTFDPVAFSFALPPAVSCPIIGGLK